MHLCVALPRCASQVGLFCIVFSFLRNTIRQIGRPEVTLLLGRPRCENGSTKLIDPRCALGAVSCRRTTLCTFPSVLEVSRDLSRTVATVLVVVMHTITMVVLGSTIPYGTLGICDNLKLFLREPLLGCCATSLPQISREGPPSRRFPAASEITVGHFLAWLARLLRSRRSLQLLAFSSYAYCRSRSALFHYGGSIIRNSLAILMALVVGVLRARSFLRLLLPSSTCLIRVLSSLWIAPSLWPLCFPLHIFGLFLFGLSRLILR